MSEELISQPLTKSLVERLYSAGLIHGKTRMEALNQIRGSLEWQVWIERLLLFMGVTLVAAGTIFFFAFNWQEMTPFQKFGLMEAAIVICLVGVGIKKLDNLSGKVLATLSGILIGGLLAVVGQVYQTGADAYQLFSGWSMLIIAWVIVARFPVYSFLWVVIVNTALILYWSQVVRPRFPDQIVITYLFLLLGGINGLALIITEYGKFRGFSRIFPSWLGALFLIGFLSPLSLSTISFFIDEKVENSFWGFLAWLASSVVACLFYRFRKRDLVSLTICSFSLLIVFFFSIVNNLFDVWNAAGFLVIGILMAGLTSLTVYFLKIIGKKMKLEEGKNV